MLAMQWQSLISLLDHRDWRTEDWPQLLFFLSLLALLSSVGLKQLTSVVEC